MRSIDVLVPSFRLNPEPILAIVDLEVPAGTEVRWIIVADNHTNPIPVEISARVDGVRVCLVRNPQNLGSAGARNAALDQSTADWVLFLDDDVFPSPYLLHAYYAAAQEAPEAIGFFGPTLFKPAQTLYQRGVEISDILTFFSIATRCTSLQWAPTSNVLLRGDAARSEKFRTIFPKAGGGEDIDYLLRITDAARRPLLAVPSASVNHPWWLDGMRDYSRFMRWSYGDSLLHDLYPRHTYRTAPNAVEFLTIGLPIAVVLAIARFSLVPLAIVLIGVPVGELVAEFFRLYALKKFPACLYCLETVLIRSANDVGRIGMQLGRLHRLRGITERWDHFCDGKHISYHQRWAAWKFAAHLAGIVTLAWLIK